METGRVIHGRYLLQRLIKQTAFCRVYQGMDQRLQRAVAVKAVFPLQIAAYRTALKMTANFSHQHILGLYDLVIEPESLYVVQEYVDGETFEALRQARLSPFEIAEAGWQMCLALMYAGSSSRRVCHGDLTPGAILRDRHGAIRLNGFALPTDVAYFEKWAVMGGDGVALLETDMPWGQQSEDRKADDTRAVGLLLYQLLTGAQEPQPDGRLRFARSTPPELCETLARALVRQHPQHIKTPEALYTHCKKLAEVLEPAPPPAPVPVAEESPARPFAPVAAGKVSLPLPARGYESGGRSLSSYSSKLPKLEAAPAEPTVADLPFTPAQQPGPAASPTLPPRPAQSASQPSPALIVLLIGLIAFGLFFTVGYFLGHALIH